MAVVAGKAPTAKFTPPSASAKTFMAIPFGPKLGRSYFGVQFGSWATSAVKGKDLFESSVFKALTGEKPVAAPKA